MQAKGIIVLYVQPMLVFKIFLQLILFHFYTFHIFNCNMSVCTDHFLTLSVFLKFYCACAVSYINAGLLAFETVRCKSLGLFLTGSRSHFYLLLNILLYCKENIL